ncbi:MAG: hypothetical protein RTU92_11360 [Candidatus Thorarchaeota archaeon]
MNIFQVLGELDKLTESIPTEETVHRLQSFLETESAVPYDPKVIIPPEFCKELHEKGADLLLRGYPGFLDKPSPLLIFKMLSQRFGCVTPFSNPIFEIYRRFAETILNLGESIEFSDFGDFMFHHIGPESKTDKLWGVLTASPDGRKGAIIVTNQRLMVIGPRYATAFEEKVRLSRLIVYDDKSPHLASADIFDLSQIEEIKSPARFLIKNLKYIESKSLSIGQDQIWMKLHEDAALKQGDFICTISLIEVKKQKKDVRKARYQALEDKLKQIQK